MHSASVRLFACGVLGTLLSAWSHAVHADTALAVGIPPQPVAAALSEFAHQTGLQLLYVSQVAQARASKGAHAGLSAADALTELLDGTGLSFQFVNARTVRIFESVAVAPTAQSTGAERPTKRAARRMPPWSSRLDEVIVTGSRDERQRSAAEYVQNVAASVSMVNADSLEAQKSETLLDYAAVIPGFNVLDYGYAGRRYVTLRGISSLTQASSVAFYLDDAPMGANGSYAGACCSVLELTPYDLERLEVLRGPQGTLYGQESQTGLIRYVLKAPSLAGHEGRVGADLSTVYGTSKPGDSLRAMINTPVVEDVLGVRVSGYETHTSGYIDNLYTGAKDVNALRQYGGRIATLWRPSESFSLNVSAFWNRINADAANVVSFAGSVRVPNTGDAYVLKPIGPLGDLTTSGPFLGPYRVNIAYYSATANWNPGSIAVVSTTSWSRTRNRNTVDASSTGALYPQLSGGTIPAGLDQGEDDWDLEKFSEELRLVSPPGGRLEWSLGGFYTHENTTEFRSDVAFDNGYHPIAAFAPYLGYSLLAATYSDRAVFGDLTWRVTGHFDLTGGLRYDRDSQAFTATTGGILGDGYPPNLNGPGQSSEGVTSWMATARYHFTPDVMLYARAASGYQPSVPPVAKAETLINYEVGLKSEFLDRKALFDLTLFYIDLSNVQIPSGDAPLGITTNSGHGRSEGLEFVSAISPLSGLKLGYLATYTEAGLTRVDSAAPAPYPAFLLAGYQTPNVPKWSLSVTADYDWQPTDRWHAHLGGVFRWIDQQWGGGGNGFAVASVDGAPVGFLPSYSVLDVNASIAKGPLTLRAYARNVTDQRGWLNSSFGVGPPSMPGESTATIIQPRTIGVGFDYAF
jgi:iron complex outermembrane recepter protein